MKEFLKRLWQCKYLLFALAIFLRQDNAIDQIIPAVLIAFFGLEITMRDLFEKYFGGRK